MKRQGIVRIRCYFMDQGYDWAGIQQATEIKVYEASRSLSHSLISASPVNLLHSSLQGFISSASPADDQ